MEIFVNKVDDVIPKLLKLDRDTLYDFKITKHREKRSLNANDYYWVLIGKIADALNQDKQSIHKTMLKSYGVIYQMGSPNKDISGIKYFELDGIREKDGKRLYIYNIYKPSSEMNTKEMAKLIDGVVETANEMEIETMTPNELKILKEEWK